jgi:hypothetical protein
MQTQLSELKKYTPEWIEMLLENYQMLIGDADELATAWCEMDERERIDHRVMAMQTWGMRMTL